MKKTKNKRKKINKWIGGLNIVILTSGCCLLGSSYANVIIANEISTNEVDVNQHKLDSYENIKQQNEKISDKLLLVNKEYEIDSTYKPEVLERPDLVFTKDAQKEEQYVDSKIIEPLENLINAAKKEGVIFLGSSGFRSYELQEKTYNNRVRTQGKELADAYVAQPGFSEHQTGLAIDLTNQKRNFAKGTKEADWLDGNCYRFGFIIRYPEGKEHVTGIKYEPWHIRYVGKEAAEIIYTQQITLEEYVEMLEGRSE
ncbi:MAG: M15 family metallopeptidase [Cellulosilyticaceae bacterium]